MQERLSDLWGLEALHPLVQQTNAVDLTLTGDVTLLTVSGERGFLNALGVLATTGLTGTPTLSLTVTIDGGTPGVFSIVNGGLILQADMAALQRSGDFNPFGGSEASGYAFGNIPYHASCLVVLNRTTGGGAGVANFTVVRLRP